MPNDVLKSMRTVSLGFGIVAALGLLLGLIPFLGWLNWIIVLPPAVLGLIFGAISQDRGAITLSGVVIGIAVFRLAAGWGLL